MNVLLCVSVLLAFGFASVADELVKPCSRCVPIQECEILSHVTRHELETWFEEFSCDTLADSEEISVPYGFATLAKGDSVCCPKSYNEVYQNPGPVLDTSIVFENEPASNKRQQDANIGNILRRIVRQDFSRAGTVDSINSQINARNLMTNNNGRNYEFPTFGSDGIPRFTNENNVGRLNRQTQRPTSSEIYFEDTATDSSTEQDYYSTQRTNQPPRRRPNSINRNQNQGINSPQTMGNPFFMTQNQRPGNSQIQMGNMQDNNSFGRRNMEQCSLTSFPPEPSTGCCGIDPSGENGVVGSQTRNFARAPSQNLPIAAPEAFLGGIFQKLFDFGNFPPRFKRADDLNVTIDSRITGGKVTILNQFPWLVLLKTTFNYGTKESAFACGGSLISAKYVLTAAHCVVDEEGRVSEVEITLAEFDKRTFPNDCINGREGRECIENLVTYAEDVISHPDFDDSRLQNDIALLRLRGRAPYTEFIRPICLPPIDIDMAEFSNIPLSVAGWGRNGRYNSDVKQSTVVNLVPQRECRRSYSQLTRRHLCAAGYSGEDTCKGDSGGPLMILYEGKYYVSGVVSGKRADSPCGTSVPSLYTNVYHYLDWIRTNMRN